MKSFRDLIAACGGAAKLAKAISGLGPWAKRGARDVNRWAAAKEVPEDWTHDVALGALACGVPVTIQQIRRWRTTPPAHGLTASPVALDLPASSRPKADRPRQNHAAGDAR